MISRLMARTLAKSPKSVLLLGPRQVGKSTLIESLGPDLSINLADDKEYLDFKSNANELRERVAYHKPNTVFVDEIQRHPSLLNTIQALLDSKDYNKGKLKFYITGSSARKLKRGEANLLPGRIFAYQLGPLAAAELNYELNVKHALKLGCLPEPYLSKESAAAEKLLTTYSGVYLKEEIQAESLVRHLDGFSRFIISSAESSGQILDFSKIAKNAKIERKTCGRFYEILEDTLLASRLEVFEATRADIKRRPKFYFFDTGVLNGLLENFTVSNDRKGSLFEHLVFNQILCSAKAHDVPVKMSYFRTKGGLEVDLIVEMKRRSYAIEIKSGIVAEGDASSLEKFRAYHKNIDGMFIVTTTDSKRQFGDIVVCGLSELLKRIGL